MAELSIAKLAIPRKQNIVRKNAVYTSADTTNSLQRPSTQQQSVSINFSGWGVIVFKNSPNDFITRMRDMDKGTISYSVVDTGTAIGGYNEKVIQGRKPDGTYFYIDPGFFLGSGLYVVDIVFDKWFYRPSLYGAYVEASGGVTLPYLREMRTDDIDHEIALPKGFLAFTVKYLVYNAVNERIEDDYRESHLLDTTSYSAAGTGGLTDYMAYAGDWQMDSITRKTKSLNLNFV